MLKFRTAKLNHSSEPGMSASDSTIMDRNTAQPPPLDAVVDKLKSQADHSLQPGSFANQDKLRTSFRGSSVESEHSRKKYTKEGYSCAQYFVNGMQRLFGVYGYYVGSYPWIFVTVTLLLVLSSYAGLTRFTLIDDLRSQFTPTNSPSLYEARVVDEYWNRRTVKNKRSVRSVLDNSLVVNTTATTTSTFIQTTTTTLDATTTATTTPTTTTTTTAKSTEGGVLTGLFHFKIITTRPGGNVLDYINDVKNLNNFVRTAVKDPVTGMNYEEICGGFCRFNAQLEVFITVFTNPDTQNNVNFRLTYPIMTIFGKKVPIGNFLFGVDTDSSPLNKTITSVRMVQFVYGTYTTDPVLYNAYLRWYRQLLRIVRLPDSDRPFPRLRAVFATEDMILGAILHTGVSVIPFVGAITLVLFFFTLFTSLRSTWRASKPFVSTLGLLVPLLGSVSAYGILFAIGQPFHPVTAISLYLVLAVGVDDVYLILHAWHRARVQHKSEKLGVADLMRHCISDCGPSITITSLTNVLSFGVGIFSSSTPSIRAFCIVTTLAMSIGYILQLTLFAPLVAIAGRIELREHELESRVAQSSRTCLSSMTACSRRMYRDVIRVLCRLYIQPCTRIVVFVLMLVYYGLSAYGVSLSQVDMRIARFLQPGTIEHDYLTIERDPLHRGVSRLDLYVLEPGDLRQPKRLQRLLSLLNDLERFNRELMLGPDATLCWLRPYVKHLSFTQSLSPMDKNQDFSYRFMDGFLHTGDNAQYRGQMIGGDSDFCQQNDPKCVQRFQCSMGFYPAAFPKLIELQRGWRSIAANYSEFRVSATYAQAFILDQVETIWPTTWKAVVLTLSMMSVVCALFVPRITNVVCATLCVFSINMGVYGLLPLWNVDLDPITMTGLLSSIGFSVDYTAHITYHYYKASSQHSYDRLVEAITGVGYPTLQAGLSSMLCAITMMLHSTYFVQTFAKVVFLVVVSGMMHGLVVLPVALSCITDVCGWWHRSGNDPNTESGSGTAPVSSNGSVQSEPVTFSSLESIHNNDHDTNLGNGNSKTV